VAYTASPIRDADARIIGTVIEVQDIRQQKAVLDALNEANRTKDQFVAMLGHELRNPLSPITALGLLRMKGAEYRELDIIARQVGNLTRLVDDLLDVSRVARGLIELRRTPIELADVVTRSIETVRPHLERARSVLKLDVPERGLVVDVDPARLAQALSNLLNNAAKFSPAGSCIRIRGWRDGARVRVAVQDEGCGIPEGLGARVFEPFVQGTQGRDRTLGGLGLGLAIAHSVVRLHDGELTMRANDGEGSGFTIDIAAYENSLPSNNLEAGQPPQTTTRPRRILIVDDNIDAAESLRQLLVSLGHDVLAVFDAASALREASQYAPDIAILDIGLPVMDGYELASRLRELFTQGNAPRLIALTGYGLPTDRARSAEAGFSEHLLKPVDFSVLTRAVDQTAEPLH
jgi:CheY-like chemotaxis protein